jgi:hypothetical protein
MTRIDFKYCSKTHPKNMQWFLSTSLWRSTDIIDQIEWSICSRSLSRRITTICLNSIVQAVTTPTVVLIDVVF